MSPMKFAAYCGKRVCLIFVNVCFFPRRNVNNYKGQVQSLHATVFLTVRGHGYDGEMPFSMNGKWKVVNDATFVAKATHVA